MDLLLEFIAEVVLQIVFELVAEVLVAVVDRLTGGRLRLNKKTLTYVFLIGFGFILGCGSLELYGIVIKSRGLQIANLIVTPILAGLLMQLIGNVKAKKGKPGLVLDRFWHGYLFALFFALGRFVRQV